jgi:acyl-CoA reductase-like NAD-dependent aldehyde dehydrogenase
VTRSAVSRIPAREPGAAGTRPSHSPMLAKFTCEARERLGPDATDSEVARAAEAARKAFYKRLSAAGVAARKAALHEALMRQRRSALAFALVEASRPGSSQGRPRP